MMFARHCVSFGVVSCLLAACGDSSPLPNTVRFDVPVHVFTANHAYTGNPDAPDASGIIVDESGKIVFVLPINSELEISAPEVTRTVFDGVIFPGFVDGHAHLSGIGQRELTLDLAGTASIAELQTRIARERNAKAAGDIIFGRGWIETDWPEARAPLATDLDAVAPDHPVILVRADGHALLANTAAITAAGIDAATPSPDGGAIERDESGAATGIFVDKAMGLLLTLVEAPSDGDLATALETGARLYASRGWTGLHNMSVPPREAPIMAQLAEEDRLPQRIHNAYSPNGFEIAAARQYEAETITNRAVKIYMDGALGSRGALLFEPYSDRPETSGLALRAEPETIALMQRAHAANVQIALHAIGDRANSYALDWMETASENTEQLRAARWRIEHAQILAIDDIARFGATGIIASMQPSHAIGDLKFAPDRLGLDRLSGAYAWRGVLAGDGIIVGGSDAPVEVGSPLIEFYAAVARKTLEGDSGRGWHPEQAVGRSAALAMFTSAPAYASFQEDQLGTLEVGKLADISVFDKDLMSVPEAEILDAEPIATVIGGKVVWER